LTEKLLPGSHKDDNRWQGKVRVGPLDLVSLRYSLEVCGGPEMIDGLAITWFDQIPIFGRWDLCHSYHGAVDKNFFVSPRQIKVRHGSDEKQLKHQELLGKLLQQCQPKITSYSLSGRNKDSLIRLCAGELLEQLGVPVLMISFGPTEGDKVYI
jgi:adenylosuccinate synthase